MDIEDDDRVAETGDEQGYETGGENAETADTSRQHLPYLPETQPDFDWDKDDDSYAEKEKRWKERSPGKFRLFLARFFSSHPAVVTCFMVLVVGIVLAAILVALHYIFNPNPPIVVIHVQLWIIWAGFAWIIGWITHGFVEIVPWIVKRLTLILKPQKSEYVRMRMAYYNSLRTPIKILLITGWMWGGCTILISIYNLTGTWDNNTYTIVVYHVLECVYLGSVLLFVEKFLLQLIVTRFHKKAYDHRIKENDRELRALDRMKKGLRKGLHTPENRGRLWRKLSSKNPAISPKDSPVVSPRHSIDNLNSLTGLGDLGLKQVSPPIVTAAEAVQEPFNDNDRPRPANIRFSNQYPTMAVSIPMTSEGTPTIETRQRNSPGANPEFIEKLTRRLVPFSSQNRSNSSPNIQRNFMRTNTVTSTTEPDPPLNSNVSVSRGTTIRSTVYPFMPNNSTSAQAKRLAKKIFNNLLPLNATRDFLRVSDLYEYFDTHSDAQKAFAIFDTDMNNEMTKQELKQGVVRIYRERKNLATSLRDLSQAAGKLDSIFLTTFGLVWVIICCAVFNMNVLDELIPLWTLFLALSFVFGGSAKDLFENIIFVFVTHPYDAGDRVFIDGNEWIIHNMGLISTSFRQWDGTILYVRNTVLTKKNIFNIRRSGPMGEFIEIQIDYNTPSQKIDSLREKLSDWCNKNSTDFTPGVLALNIFEIESTNKIHCVIWVEHRSNWQDMMARYARRTKFYYGLKEALDELDIRYVLPAQPIVHRELQTPLPFELSHPLGVDKNDVEGLRHRASANNFKAPGAEEAAIPQQQNEMGMGLEVPIAMTTAFEMTQR
ncbi:Mechanosensitive ion channel-domain-containing protein [Endogone sp. FLAS-F59071]|nr:Mechanosensitive ion channel-domain-containing protein [Endogone sp. FLAS-F59071]|eukprot:RUS16522.1 Mechanosensitive ion channel-domain-containing protein [Endogone sp. FLAS-F59071]